MYRRDNDDDKDHRMSRGEAHELISGARGDIDRTTMEKRGAPQKFNKSIYQRLRTGEQPHFISGNGVFYEDENHSISTSKNKNIVEYDYLKSEQMFRGIEMLTITDQRIMYVLGEMHAKEDMLEIIHYSDIKDAYYEEKIIIDVKNGKYGLDFFKNSSKNDIFDELVSYIKKRANDWSSINKKYDKLVKCSHNITDSHNIGSEIISIPKPSDFRTVDQAEQEYEEVESEIESWQDCYEEYQEIIEFVEGFPKAPREFNINFNQSEYDPEQYESVSEAKAAISEAKDRLPKIKNEIKTKISDSLEGKINTLRSELDEIDALDKNESIDEAQARLDEINQKLESTKQEARQYDFVDLSDDFAHIDERKENLLDDVSEIRLEQCRQDIRDETETIYSEIDEIDTLVEEESLEEAEMRAEEIKSEIKSVESTIDEEEAESFETLRDDLTQLKQQRENLLDKISKIQLEQRHQKIKNGTDSIYSYIDESNNLIEQGSLDEAEKTIEKIESKIKSIRTTINNQQSGEFGDLRDDLTQLNQQRENLLEEVDVLRQNRYQREIENKIATISVEIDEIETLVEEESLDEAKKRAEQIESEIESVEASINKNDSGEFEDLLDNITQFSRQREHLLEEISEIRRGQRRQNLENELDDLRSRLNNADTLTEQGSLDEAQANLDEIDSSIASVQSRAKQHGFDTLRDEAEKTGCRCQKMLEKVTDLIESNTIQRLAEGSVQADQYSKQSIITQLREMDPYAFEELVAKIWQTQGWDAEATSGSTDRGVDVVAVKQDAFEKRRHLIQAKRHSENSIVGSEDIQKYASLYQRDEQVDNVFIVTSNRFTKEAKEVAEGRDVSLVNVDELYDMLIST